MLGQARTPRLRTMRQFAEEEVVIPDGPFEGRRFRCNRQPYTALWFAQVDSGHFNTLVATGPTQSGKTLCAYVIPIMYHLFEIGETVIAGLPDMRMAGDKWREDLWPAIKRSRYAKEFRGYGAGSRGGPVIAIQFANGATLRFMSGGGGDKSRAGYTTRVVVITETDGMDEAGGGSRETDKISQFIARTSAWDQALRVYMECTVSIEEGRTWREIKGGTDSRIVLPCPHCRQYVTPDREHFTGWEQGESAIEAGELAAFHCPACGKAWSEDQRADVNAAALLVHRGQSIDPDGEITGDPPRTKTLGFRWTAVNNRFVTANTLGKKEWQASHAADEDNAEKEMCQFVWARPWRPPLLETTALDQRSLQRRVSELPRGVVPAGANHLTVALDLGKYLAHFAVIAWTEGAGGHVVDYGRLEIATDDFGVEKAILITLRAFRDQVQRGWACAGDSAKGGTLAPDQVWIDAGYQKDVVCAFCRESSPDARRARYRPTLGRGETQRKHLGHGQSYRRPKKTGATVRHVGEEYHLSWFPADRVHIVEVNADYWKTWIHRRLATPADAPGSLTFFSALPNEHLALSKHLTAERQEQQFVPDKGTIIVWRRIRANNHWLDAFYNAAAAGHFCGARLTETKPGDFRLQGSGRRVERNRRTPLTMPDGRPYLLSERN